MKKLLLALPLATVAALAVIKLSAAATSAPAAVVGVAAPEFALSDLNGKTVKLSDFKGKTVVLEWVNPECPFVVKHYESGNIPKTQKSATDDGVIWLTINSGAKGQQGDFSPAQVAAWMKDTKAAPTAYFRDQDGKVGRLYGAKTTPHIFVINGAGTLVYEGAIDSIATADKADIAKATNYAKAALDAVKADKPVEKTNTAPYGCTVKY
jgi:hypothetical protein